MMLPITAMLIGGLLGLQFKALILVPVIIAGSVATFLIGIVQNESLETVGLATVSAILTLQLGYLFGALAHRAPQSRTAPRRAAPTGQNAFRIF